MTVAPPPAVTRTYWCELAWLGDAQPESAVAIEVADGVIAAVRRGAPRRGTVLGGLVLPGLANTHSHAFQRALRGRTHAARGTFWTWREQMYSLAARLDPERLRAVATATYAEMLCAGYTCVGEFHYVHHGPGGERYREPNAMGDALAGAAEASGMRITLLDACYLRGEVGVALGATQRRFSDGTADAWAERATGRLAPSPLVRLGAAVHSVRAVDAASIAIVAETAAGNGWVLHAHVSEQPAENEQCRAEHGCSPAELLAAAGALAVPFTAVHATHLGGYDVELLGSHGASVALCPTTERDLADGVASTAALAAAGVALTVGSDSQACIDPFEEVRAVEMNTRLVSGQRGTHSAAELLAGATAGGYRCLGWPGGGVLAPGAPADFVAVGLESPRLIGADPGELLAAVVFAATAPDVREVVVGGEHLVSEGTHQRLDVRAALRDALEHVWRG